MTGLLTNAERSYRFDVRQFHRMMAAGIFEDQKVELVAGKIYPMTDLPPHTDGTDGERPRFALRGCRALPSKGRRVGSNRARRQRIRSGCGG